jgi:hypothetical protein
MEITKKHWMIIGIVVGGLAIYYFFIRKTKMTIESGYRSGCENGRCKCNKTTADGGAIYLCSCCADPDSAIALPVGGSKANLGVRLFS